MQTDRYRNSGFTIVELLIVVVVIAILATISVVAYTGIQHRASDAAVQNDISNLAKKIRLAAVESGEFPPGGATRVGGVNSGTSTSFPNFTFAPARSAYSASVNNLYYCTGVETASGEKIFRLYARSASGTTFRYISNSGLEGIGGTAFSSTTVCQGMDDPQTWSYGQNTAGTWFTWTNG